MNFGSILFFPKNTFVYENLGNSVRRHGNDSVVKSNVCICMHFQNPEVFVCKWIWIHFVFSENTFVYENLGNSVRRHGNDSVVTSNVCICMHFKILRFSCVNEFGSILFFPKILLFTKTSGIQWEGTEMIP